jgi:hypothetical protein
MKSLTSKAAAATACALLSLVSFSTAQTHTKAPAQRRSPNASAKEQLSPEELKKRKDWNDRMLRKAPPGKGCFKLEYPKTDWVQVPCGQGKQSPAIPRRGPRTAVIGNSNDISAQSPSGEISQAIGSFETVNVTSESGPIDNAGPSVTDAYSLQINTNQFGGVCSGSPNPGCLGWEQFVLSNDGTTGNLGKLFIQYWLIKYNANCPPMQNWTQFQFTGGGDIYCYKNALDSSNGWFTQVPSQPISNLANMRISASVTSASDSVTVSTGATTMYNRTGDNAVNVASGWNTAEWNIFGDLGNSQGGGTASFNAGASIIPHTEIIYAGDAAPVCAAEGFTGEMNNLSFGPAAPAAATPGPAITFEESLAGGATSNCAAASTIGDTHLRTFNGLLYDFQAAGDFTLADTGKDFSVQTRQVSGAPTWPNATVNKAVAARFGSTQVAVCLAPDDKRSGGIYVDGKLTEVSDGAAIELPGEVDIARQGNQYVITSENGNSVLATVNATYIDVAVGLGRWPSTVRGLVANAGGNVHQIATSTGVVLTSPFRFDDLYLNFADSWRVPRGTSMLSICDGGAAAATGAPTQPFYAGNLEVPVREKAQQICTVAGVKPGALLDACTLDVAVIGQESAAKVFVSAVQPAAVGVIVRDIGFFARWWWLLLLVVLFVIFLVWVLARRLA